MKNIFFRLTRTKISDDDEGQVAAITELISCFYICIYLYVQYMYIVFRVLNKHKLHYTRLITIVVIIIIII